MAHRPETSVREVGHQSGGEVAVRGFSQSRPNAVAPSVIRYRLPDILFMNKSK